MQSITWNHGISSVVSSLIDNQLSIASFKEYDYAPYPFVKGCEEYETGKYRIKHFEQKVPLVYSIEAIKK